MPTFYVLLGVVLLELCADSTVMAGQINKMKEHVTYEQLQKPQMSLYKSFYFFNLTNAEEFASMKGGVKPMLKEIGPYSYIEYRIKNFTIHDSANDLFGYTQTKTFQFDSTTSGPNLTEADVICTINLPLVDAMNNAKDSFLERAGLRTLITLTGAKIYTCQEATALAWNYSDSFIRGLHKLGKYPLNYVNIQVNNSIMDRNLSIIYGGKKDPSVVGEFVQWDGLKLLNIWPKGTGANFINGTEGLYFKPNLKKGSGLTVFVDDIQRSIDLVYTGGNNSIFHYGIDNITFKSAFTEPENARWKTWAPDGMFYLGPTQEKEMPVYGSKPHFLDGDPGLLDSIVGIKPPDREKHDSIFDVNPITGDNISFKRQLQIVVQVNRSEKLPFYEFPFNETENIIGFNGTGSLYIPVLSVNEHGVKYSSK